jgi:hypothetical protein
MVSDKLKDEQAYTAKIANANSLYNSGIINQDEKAQYLGFEKADEPEPRAIEDIAGTGKTGEGKTDTSKTGNKDLKAKDSNVKHVINLSRETIQELVQYSTNSLNTHTVDITLANGEIIEDVEVKNYATAISDVAFDAQDVLSIDVNTLESLEFALGKGAPMFEYASCASEKMFDTAYFENEVKIFKYLDNYHAATKKVYSAATKKVIRKIAVELGNLTEGASLQQVQDRTVSILYKQWGKSFSQAQKKVINKWVEVSYRAFKKDKSIFDSFTGKVPESTFGLRDFRALEYFKNSDSLYLGKFVTDEDTKKRITEFIKEEYFEKGIPVGNNQAVTDSFRSKFEGVLEGEAWKITSVLSTTVNKMRNYAAASYMSDAGVEKFEVRGIVDRKQCGYCASMQGRQFTLAKTISKLDTVVASSPEYVSAITPFVSSVFKGKEGLSELQSLTDEQVQDKNIDLPSYHCHCRDRIIAVL